MISERISVPTLGSFGIFVGDDEFSIVACVDIADKTMVAVIKKTPALFNILIFLSILFILIPP